MNNIYIPTVSPDDWRRLLADPDLHWRTGKSAKTLAHAWEDANGLPTEIATLFTKSAVASIQKPELLIAIPEHKVSLPPPGGRASQNDVFALARVSDGLVAITIEGKVQEPFGPTIGTWKQEMSDGKRERLNFIVDTLKIAKNIPENIRYQLLHRTVSAVLEAKRFHASYAAMIVHAFGDQPDSLADYVSFLKLFGANYSPDALVPIANVDGIQLCSGWAQGNAQYLEC